MTTATHRFLTPFYVQSSWILKSAFIISFFFTAISGAFAQITVSTSRTTANFEAGENMQFTIVSAQGGTVQYKIGYDQYTPAITSGSVVTSPNVPAQVPFTLSQPGAVFMWATQNGQSNRIQAVFSPHKIQPAETEPSDFDAFWDGQKNLLAQVPIAPQLTFYNSTNNSTTYKMALGHIEGRKVYGYISIPNGTGPFPAMIQFPPFGQNAGLVHSISYMTDELGAIGVTISIHNADPDATDPNAYLPNDPTDKNKIYYRYAILAGLRVIQYLDTRADFDKQNIALMGESQGGGLSLMVAGLSDSRVKVVIGSLTALSEHAAWKYGKATGFPNYVNTANISTYGNQTVVDNTVAATKYYDVQFFAKRYAGPTLTAASYKDDVSPVATIFSAINQAPLGRQTIIHALNLEHNHPDQYWLAKNESIRQFIPSTRTPQNNQFPPSTTGYFVDAGEDVVGNVGQAINLTGKIERNQAPASNLIPKWDLISGPGTATFSNAQSLNTSATFSASGTYIVRLSSVDESLMASKQTYYSFSDLVKITVQNSAPTSYLTVSSNSLDIAPLNNSTSTLGISSNTNWWASSNQPWLTLSSASGTGDATLTLTAQANTTTAQRSATITIYGPGIVTQTITVIQQNAAVYLTVSSNSLYFPGSSVNNSFSINSNTSWSITSSQPWLTVNPSTGNGPSTITITTQDNPSTADRAATLTVSGAGVPSETILIFQSGLSPFMVVSTNSIAAPAISGSDFVISVNSNISWSAASDQNWLSINPATGSGNGLLSITIPTNLYTVPRTATITVWGTGVPLQTITVTQSGATPAIVVSSTAVNLSSNTSTALITVNANIPWNASSNQSWLTISPASGSGNGQISILPAANTSTTARTATITLSGNGATPQTITVTQAGTAATLTVSNTAISLPASNSSATVSVSSNVSWSATSSQNWLSISPTSGNGNGQINISTAQNTSTSPRTATITVSGTGVPSRSITVTQSGAAAVLTLSSNAINMPANTNNVVVSVSSNIAWSATKNQPWVTISPVSGNGNGQITIFAQANPSTTSRTAIVTVSGTGVTSKTITITQVGAAPSLNVSSSLLNMTANTASTTFAITSNVSWTVASNQSWLTMTPISGAGNRTINVGAQTNTSTTARSATITITGTGGVSKTVTVTQAAAAAALSVSTNSINMAASASSSVVSVVSNVAWNVSSNQSWLTVSPSSGQGSGSFTITATQNSFNYTQNATVTVTGAGVGSRTITVAQSGTSATVCEPKGLEPYWQWIGSVSFSNMTKNSSKEQFGNFTDSKATVERGKTYPIRLKPAFSYTAFDEFWRVWIDYNNDGIFDENNEKVYENHSTEQLDGSITIPSTASPGVVKMRVAMKNGSYPSPCEVFQYGEVEDYSVEIKVGSVNNNTCSISAQATNIVCLDNGTPNDASDDQWRFTLNVTANNGSVQGWRTSGNPYFLNGNYGISVNSPTIPFIGNQFYTIKDKSDSTCITTILVAQPAPCVQVPPVQAVPYCASQSLAPWHEWLNSVQVNNTSLSFNSGKTTYSNFTSNEAAVVANVPNTVKIGTQFSWLTYIINYKIWIDYNQNGVFEEPSEVAFTGSSDAPAPGNGNAIATVSGNFTVPATARNGKTRMRVVMSPSANLLPCGDQTEGEVEDYSIVISGGQYNLVSALESVAFEAIKSNGEASLEWVLRHTNDLKTVQIERSADGQNYYPWGNLLATDQLFGKTYDADPLEGDNYYRLKINYLDGTTEYSATRKLNFDKISKNSLFPVPAKNEVWINAENYENLEMTVEIIDVQGRVSLSKNLGTLSDKNVRVDLSELQDGYYQVRLLSPGVLPVTKKLIVNKGH